MSASPTLAKTPVALEVRGLRKVYPGRRGRSDKVAVDRVDLTIPAGGSLAVVGESGSGKTTTARMIVGQESPTAGTILLGGDDCSRPPRGGKERRRRGGLVQMVFQDPYTSLDPRQTVGSCIDEALALHTELTGPERRDRTRELLDSVGLDERHLQSRPSGLSGGQRQRVAIARALAPEPPLLVLDEAVSALDVSIQAQVLNLLGDIRERTGVSFLFISHDLAVVREIADEVLVLWNGRTVEHGSTEHVLDDPQHAYTQRLRASVPGPGWIPTRQEPLPSDS